MKKNKILKQELPDNFSELLITGSLSDLKAIFEKYGLDARGYSNQTALSYRNNSIELTRWLIEQGADIAARDNYQNTPLHNQASYRFNTVEILLECGADIEVKNGGGDTPLHIAVGRFNVDTVKTLLHAGADCHASNRIGQTPLEKTLANCRNVDIIHVTQIIYRLLLSGVILTEESRKSVRRIGTEFEFYKSKFNPEKLADTEASLKKLYQLTKVDPIPERVRHDGESIIKVRTINWQDQHEELWQLLVPASGQAETIQGEMIRVTGKLSHELYGNGGSNWDSDFEMMVMELQSHFQTGKFSFQTRLQANRICQLIPKLSEESDLEKLTELAVEWILENPIPIKLGKVSYQR